MINFSCPICKTAIEVSPSQIGTKIPCPQCGQRLQVPAPARNKTILGDFKSGETTPARTEPVGVTSGQTDGAPGKPAAWSTKKFFSRKVVVIAAGSGCAFFFGIVALVFAWPSKQVMDSEQICREADAFQASVTLPGHKATLLDRTFEDIGLGFAKTTKNVGYWVVIVAARQ